MRLFTWAALACCFRMGCRAASTLASLPFITSSMGDLAAGMKSSTNTSTVSTRLSRTARAYSLAPHTMPMLMDQNRNTRSMGSFTALRKRTMDSAPTLPREMTKLLCMASRMPAVITGSMARLLLKSRE